MNRFALGLSTMTRPKYSSIRTVFLSALLGLSIAPAYGESLPTAQVALQVTVNSAQDGPIQADDALTLREAIGLVNGTLPVAKLSAQEAVLVKPNTEIGSEIQFDLPDGDTKIALKQALPPLMASGLVIDGTSQPGYFPSKTEIVAPIVAITPAKDAQIRRGLTVMADRITIRGLSLYGFTQAHNKTATALPADILIANPYLDQFSAEDRTAEQDQFFVGDRIPQENRRVMMDRTEPPQGTVIEQNWLGISPDGNEPAVRSAFGVSVFNGTETQIKNNRIAGHDGSAIITGVDAQKTLIEKNEIVRNGQAGMPDAIRLEGMIEGTRILSNQIAENDGSAIYLFKSEGAVTIQDNKLTHNGRRFERAAVVLMGNGHQVLNNEIGPQPGPGVVVAAYPKSDRNMIENNRFVGLKGLSIDLIAREHTDVPDYQVGDGPNPLRNSGNRRLDTANQAINTPQFLSPEFLWMDNRVNIDGVADPGMTVMLYRVMEEGELRGPLSEPLAQVVADKDGKFGFTLTNVKPGDRLSAIASHPNYGTSEPALNVLVR
jgi:hypothetical protein